MKEKNIKELESIAKKLDAKIKNYDHALLKTFLGEKNSGDYRLEFEVSVEEEYGKSVLLVNSYLIYSTIRYNVATSRIENITISSIIKNSKTEAVLLKNMYDTVKFVINRSYENMMENNGIYDCILATVITNVIIEDVKINIDEKKSLLQIIKEVMDRIYESKSIQSLSEEEKNKAEIALFKYYRIMENYSKKNNYKHNRCCDIIDKLLVDDKLIH